MRSQRFDTGRGGSIRVATILGRQLRDQTESLETVKRPVERSGTELHSGERLDVLDQRVAVFRTVGEARQDQYRRVARSTKDVVCVVVSGSKSKSPNTVTDRSVNVIVGYLRSSCNCTVSDEREWVSDCSLASVTQPSGEAATMRR